jgi:hypothetical protein
MTCIEKNIPLVQELRIYVKFLIFFQTRKLKYIKQKYIYIYLLNFILVYKFKFLEQLKQILREYGRKKFKRK